MSPGQSALPANIFKRSSIGMNMTRANQYNVFIFV